MDATERKMTKIAREVSKFTVQTMKEDGIGTAEFDFIHLVRHNPGITQAASIGHRLSYHQILSSQGSCRKACGESGEQGIPLPEAQPGGWQEPAVVCHGEGGAVEKLQGCH